MEENKHGLGEQAIAQTEKCTIGLGNAGNCASFN